MAKVQEKVCQDRDCSIDKGRAVLICKAKLGIHPPLHAGVLLSPGKKLATFIWEDKHLKSKCPPFFLLPPAFNEEHDARWSGISFQLSWLLPLPASCPSPVWSGMGQFEKRPWCCIIIAQHYLKTWVCRQCCCVTNL